MASHGHLPNGYRLIVGHLSGLVDECVKTGRKQMSAYLGVSDLTANKGALHLMEISGGRE